ncbi:MAG: hypothetical protein ACYYK0_04650 [Candidatus Eutrophobiaceae bacterium]
MLNDIDIRTLCCARLRERGGSEQCIGMELGAIARRLWERFSGICGLRRLEQCVPTAHM